MSRYYATQDAQRQTEWFPVPRKIIYIPRYTDDGRVHGFEPRHALVLGRYLRGGPHHYLVTTDGITSEHDAVIAYCFEGEYIFDGRCFTGRPALDANLKRAHEKRTAALEAENEASKK